MNHHTLRTSDLSALARVVSVLNSFDPEQEVAKLRSHHAQVESVVDEVVERYHTGFNKAIQNYSQILRLFSDSEDRVNNLRSNLQETGTRAVVRGSTLYNQWSRSITLAEILRILEQIESAIKVPQQLQQLAAEKSFDAAATLLQDTNAMIQRNQLSQVGALRALQVELTEWKEILTTQMLEQLLDSTFSTSERRGTPSESCTHSAATGRSNGAGADTGHLGINLDRSNGDPCISIEDSKPAEVCCDMEVQSVVRGLTCLQTVGSARSAIRQRLRPQLRALFSREIVRQKDKKTSLDAQRSAPPVRT
ncbi:hypothetical protein CYMTET_36372, partial [Cymbomonas tetramitiformis]